MTEMKRIIKTDLYRYDGLTGITGFIKGWFIPGFRYMCIFRIISHSGKYTPHGIFFRILKRHYRFKYGFEINNKAQIGPGFYLTSHCGPVIVGPVKIGKNCNISHSVTIGRSYNDGNAGRPTIDDYVWIGAGAVLVGKIKIGRNVLIAPNSYVNFDVPDNSLVLGNPGRIVKSDYSTDSYIRNIPD